MKPMLSKKILEVDQLPIVLENLRRAGKRIVQCHGVFDLIHPGLMNHFAEARAQGDVLVVSVVRDRDVHAGSGRPLFNEALRIANVAGIESVDYACIVDDSPPFECVSKLQPDIFAKKKGLLKGDREIHEEIFVKNRERYFGCCSIYETQGFTITASQIAKQLFALYPEHTKEFLTKFGERYSFHDVAAGLDSLRKLKVLLVGDGIIDEYHYCSSMGRARKAPLIVYRYQEHEVFAGGAFAIANHLSGICESVHLVTLLGNEDSREGFVRSALRSNVEPAFFFRDDGPTVVKKRYLDQYVNQKVFEVNYLNPLFLSREVEKRVIDHCVSRIADYDLVLIADFGHGLLTPDIIEALSSRASVLAVNAQMNAANAGFNLITRYRSPQIICLDEPEARVAAQAQFNDIETVAHSLRAETGADCLVVTLGKSGSIAVTAAGETTRCPIFSTNVVDTVGAGDAFFSFAAPSYAAGLPPAIVSFIGNAVGALAVAIVGNKRPVEKHEVMEFIQNLLY